MPQNSLHEVLAASLSAAISQGLAERDARNGEGPITVNVTTNDAGEVTTEIVKAKGTAGDS